MNQARKFTLILSGYKMQLVIAEKPSVARSIAGVIGATEKHDGYLQGNGYLVSWCIGHLVSFADAGRYDERFKKWRYEDLLILPETWQYIIPDEKNQQFDILRSLMERPDVTGLVCATDAGREGELIFRFVYQMAGCEKPFKRLWISSMEDSAIRDGFAHLKPGTDYDPLYQSALCRAKADWVVGINATRLFSVLYHKTLTVGRVQTPTLNLLVERDAKITNFKKEKYHIVHIGVGGTDTVSSRFSDAGEANTVKAACAGAQAVCVSVTREKKTEQPPKLYDLTTLQREANRLFGLTAKQTLDYAQTLYEKKLLTYPRTDSQYLTDDMLPVAENLVAGPYVYEAVTATFTCAGKEFTAKGRTVFSPGWKEIDRRFRSSLKTASDEDAETVRELPELKEGQTFADVAASVTEYFTTPLFWKSWFRWALSRERVSSSFPPRTASIWPWYCRRL